MIEIEDFSAYGSGTITWKENGVQQPTDGSTFFEKTYNEAIRFYSEEYDESLYIQKCVRDGVSRTVTFNAPSIEVTKKVYTGCPLYLNGDTVFDNCTSRIYENGAIYCSGNTVLGIDFKFDNDGVLTLSNGYFNFDGTSWTTSGQSIVFGSNASLKITTSTNGKTIIKCSSVTGTITLDVDSGVQDGDTFLIEATDNQLVITDGDWTATPSTSGNITTYTLAKAAVPKPKFRMLYTIG